MHGCQHPFLSASVTVVHPSFRLNDSSVVSVISRECGFGSSRPLVSRTKSDFVLHFKVTKVTKTWQLTALPLSPV